MSSDTVVDLAGRKSFSEKVLPYIVWERKTRKANDEVVVVKKPMQLFDRYGSPFTWVDPLTINYYLRKGWKIADYGNFDFPEKHLGAESEHLTEIATIVAGQSENYQTIEDQAKELQAKDAEIDRLRAQLANRLGGTPASARGRSRKSGAAEPTPVAPPEPELDDSQDDEIDEDGDAEGGDLTDPAE